MQEQSRAKNANTTVRSHAPDDHPTQLTARLTAQSSILPPIRGIVVARERRTVADPRKVMAQPSRQPTTGNRQRLLEQRPLGAQGRLVRGDAGRSAGDHREERGREIHMVEDVVESYRANHRKK